MTKTLFYFVAVVLIAGSADAFCIGRILTLRVGKLREVNYQDRLPEIPTWPTSTGSMDLSSQRKTVVQAGFMDFLSGNKPQEQQAEALPVTEEIIAEEPERLSLPVRLMQAEKGKRGGFRVDYKAVLAGIARASRDASSQGVRLQQVEFPFDAEDQGTTLVKRFETLVSLSERLAQVMGLQGVVSIGEDITIRDNINPGGGGEYLDKEGIFGLRGTLPQGDQVALLMLASVDTSELQELEKILYSQDGGRLDRSARVLLINTGMDKLTANKGFLGFGGAPAFLQGFAPVYYAKQLGNGFLFRDFSYSGWHLWGLPLDGTQSDVVCVKTLEQKPAIWEAEQAIKGLCRQ